MKTTTNIQSKVRDFASLIFAVLALLFAVIVAVSPVKTQSFQYDWNPTAVEDSGVLPLDRWWPENLEITFVNNCEGKENRQIFSSGTLSISCEGDSIYVVSKLQNLPTLNASLGDQIEFKFDSKTSNATIFNKSTNLQKSKKLEYINFPQFTKLEIFDPSDRVVVQLLTRPATLDFSSKRLFFSFLALIFGVISICLYRRTAYKIQFDFQRSVIISRWRQHLLVLLGLFASALALPMFYDDGWVLQRVSQATDVGFFGDYFFHSNAWLPQGFITESIYSALLQIGFTFLTLRLWVVLLLFVTWLVLLCSAVLLKEHISSASVWVSASVYLAISSVWCVSLRAEAWICLFVSFQILFFAKYLKSKSYIYFTVSGIFAGLAFATHQTGFISLIPLGIMVLFAIRNDLRENLIPIVKSLILVGTFSVLIFFFGYDFTTILLNTKDFADGYYQNRLNEFFRIGEIAGPAYSSARKFAWLLYFVALGLSLYSFRRITGVRKILASAVILLPIGLILTSSKWGWHLGILAIPATLLFLLTQNFPKNKTNKLHPQFVVLLPILTLFVAISLAAGGGWGTYDSRQFDWAKFGLFFAGPDKQLLWLLLFILAIAAGVFADSGRKLLKLKSFLGIFLSSLMILLPAALTFAWISADSFIPRVLPTSSWTMFRQNIKSIVSPASESCGILGSAQGYTSDISPLKASLSETNLSSFNQMLNVDAEGFSIGHIDAWSNASLVEDQLVSPWFDLNSADQVPISFWWKSNGYLAGDYAFVSLNYQLSDGSVSKNQLPLYIENEVIQWSKYDLSPPTGATKIQFEATSNSARSITLTSPASQTMSSAKAILATGTALIPPSYLPAVPCAKLGSSAQGLFPRISFLVGASYQYDLKMWIDQYFPSNSPILTEIGNIEAGAPSIWGIYFQNAKNLYVYPVYLN